MTRTLTPLTDDQLAAIAWADPTETTAALARRIAAPYFTVHQARRRFNRDGGWFCALARSTCPECGRPLLSSAANPRDVHHACEAARAARWSRERRAAGRPGSKSTPYVRAWRERNPQRHAAIRDREKARLRAEWPDRPEPERDAALAKVHAADQRDYPLTRDRADRAGAPWTADEDAQILDRLDDPARDVALDLGRSLWAVRTRRKLLRRRQPRE